MENLKINSQKTPYVMLGMPIPPNRLVDIQTGLFCGALARTKNTEFCGKVAHETGHGRNLIIMDALKKPHVTHIFFLDADTIPPDNALAELLKLDKDIAAGLYKITSPDGDAWSASTGTNNGVDYSWVPIDKLPTEPFKAWALAGGCLLVKRKVFEAGVGLAWPWFSYIYKPDGGRVGEDVNFTNKAKDAGFELWAHPGVIAGHNQRRVR